MIKLSDEELFGLYREGKLIEAEMSQEQINAVMRVYEERFDIKKLLIEVDYRQ